MALDMITIPTKNTRDEDKEQLIRVADQNHLAKQALPTQRGALRRSTFMNHASRIIITKKTREAHATLPSTCPVCLCEYGAKTQTGNFSMNGGGRYARLPNDAYRTCDPERSGGRWRSKGTDREGPIRTRDPGI